VAIAAATGDEDSFTRTSPAPTTTRSTSTPSRHDSSSLPQATTFINFDNCSNYGAQSAHGRAE